MFDLLRADCEPKIVPIPLYSDRCPAGFPSPAIFPSGAGCQFQLPDKMLNILSELETR